METGRHFSQMVLLVDSLRLAWKDRNDFYVGGNMFLYYSEAQARRNDFRGPDVFVVLGTEKRERRSWVVWEEGGKCPDVVIELLSPSTEATDRGEKMRIYAEVLRVGEYFLFDPWTAELEGYELEPGSRRYRRKTADARGLVECKQLGLWLGVVHGEFWSAETDWLRWVDRAGRVLPCGEEEAMEALARAEQAEARAEQAEARAEQEARAREGAAQRIAELEAQLRRQG